MSRGDETDILAEMRRWQATLADAMGLAEAPCDTDLILALASTISREVVRPAVPVTAYLVGMAIGLAAGRGEDLDEATSKAFALAMDPAALQD